MLTDTTQRRLETLGTLSREGKRINGPFRLLENYIMWEQAYANIYSNAGAVTAGVDGTSLDGFSYKRIDKLIASIKDSSYRFKPVKRVLIPKSNGKTRPLGIPSGDDKMVQEVVRMILAKIYEPVFSNNSHGFRAGRSCHTALMQVKEKWSGIKWIVNMDIKGYFDNIDHEKLMGILAKRIDDKRFLMLIWSMLKAGYVEDWKYHDTYSGTPQGGIVSPILANIYLHELDEFMHGLKVEFNHGKCRMLNKEYRSVTSKIQWRMKCIDKLQKSDKTDDVRELMQEITSLDKERKKLSSVDPMDANFRRLVYVRYADDFLIGVISSRNEAITVMQSVSEFLENTLGLEIARDKSGIVHASDGVRFLGYDVRTFTAKQCVVKTVRVGRHTTFKRAADRMQLHMPVEKLRNFCQKKRYGVYDTYKALHRSELIELSEAEIIQTYNAEMRGFINYYGIANSARRNVSKLYALWQTSLFKTLAAKRQSSVSQVARSMRNGTSYCIVVSSDKGNKVISVFGYRDMKCKPSEFAYIDLPPMTWQFTHTRSELIQRLNAKACEFCGKTTGELEVHHIRKLSDVEKGKSYWQLQMARRRRKTMVLCMECHHKLHAGTLG